MQFQTHNKEKQALQNDTLNEERRLLLLHTKQTFGSRAKVLPEDVRKIIHFDAPKSERRFCTIP